MIYYKNKKKNIRLTFLFVLFILAFLIFLKKEYLRRSIVTVYFGSLYNEILDQKATLSNYFSDIKLDQYYFTLSKNNYIRLQLERSKMISNFKIQGTQWNLNNTYYKSKIKINEKSIKGKLKLFGMNPDHFRSQNGHSFRVKYKKGGEKLGNRKLNYINPRSRDFVTDYLVNLIYFKLYDGIRINYKPVEVFLNKNRFGIMLEESFFDKYLIETNNRRESVIFEINNNEFYFNHLDNDSDSNYSGYLEDLYFKNYTQFLKKIDINKVRSLIILGMIINDEHPFSPINLHWYYNPVSDFIEPTIRESFVHSINENNTNYNKILNNNQILLDLSPEIEKEISFSNVQEDLDKIKGILLNDNEYLNFKNKLSGFKNFIIDREDKIFKNIDLVQKSFKTRQLKNIKKVKVFIKNDTIMKGEIEYDKNTELVICPGVNIKIDGALIKFKGSLTCVGTKNSPIKFQGTNKSGTLFFQGNEKIVLKHTEFKNLTNLNSKQIQPASITFYNSKNIRIDNCTFEKNYSGDDYLNFFKSNNIEVNSSLFKNVKNDAIDSDFSAININNSKFLDIGNDAIDGSGSKITISNCDFKNIYDKAISAGEESFFEVDNINVSNSEIGIVSKDKSSINIKNSTFYKNNLDFASFIKKDFFGTSKANFSNTTPKSYLIEHGSNIDGLQDIIYSNKVEKKLYGNMYGRASKK